MDWSCEFPVVVRRRVGEGRGVQHREGVSGVGAGALLRELRVLVDAADVLEHGERAASAKLPELAFPGASSEHEVLLQSHKRDF